jgi:hypothetical protein
MRLTRGGSLSPRRFAVPASLRTGPDSMSVRSSQCDSPCLETVPIKRLQLAATAHAVTMIGTRWTPAPTWPGSA